MHKADADRTHGEAWLVGAGPGDPELLSLRGFHLLQHADVVLHDRLIAPELLAFARRDAELIDVGKTGGGPGTSQATINALLLDRVRAGKRVCRLKGGDPYVFGRGSEEAAALAEAGLPFQVIPGITAANGCGAYAGIPLTHRGLAQAVTFVTGHAASDDSRNGTEPDWAALAALRHTLVIYMSGRKLAVITAELIANGRSSRHPGRRGDRRHPAGATHHHGHTDRHRAAQRRGGPRLTGTPLRRRGGRTGRDARLAAPRRSRIATQPRTPAR
jgi:uroporphyrin-III C-methyltransferase